MFLLALLRHGLRLLVPFAIASTIYLYLYPVFHACSFPLPPSQAEQTGRASLTPFLETAKLHFPFPAAIGTGRRQHAPFRLLALGDPQLEGDTSIPQGDFVPHLKSFLEHVTFKSEESSPRQRIRRSLHDVVDFFLDDIPNEAEKVRKRIDLVGNDFYLAHIYRTMRWWSKPTHITALGDLVGSQWIGDEEFERRGGRYWNRVFAGGERVPDNLASFPASEYDLAAYLDSDAPETKAWNTRILNVAGNHDIGYAGDLTVERLNRFERVFGKVNYELRFELPIHNSTLNATIFDEETNPESDRLPPELRIIVLNDMNLDTPALNTQIQDDTYSFVNAVIDTSSAVEFHGHFTVVLTHIPLYKPEGVCVDAPFFDFHGDGGVKEQNQLSQDASRGFLEGIFGMSGDTGAAGGGRGRYGLIMNGHDHEGCDTYHYINQSDAISLADRHWEVSKWETAKSEGFAGQERMPGRREITVRSMMGDLGGNAGLLSVWFDETAWGWKYEFENCALGTQHIWWIVHIVDVIALIALLLYVLLKAILPIKDQKTGPVIKKGLKEAKQEI
jgi:hypothetical protein